MSYIISEFIVCLISQASFSPFLNSSSAIRIALSLQLPIVGFVRNECSFIAKLFISFKLELGTLPMDI